MTSDSRIEHARLDSPIGPLEVYSRDGVLVGVEFAPSRLRSAIARRFPHHPLVSVAATVAFAAPLKRYFDGDLHAFDDVAADPGGTPFQSRVWRELRRIPVGRTLSYRELARRLGAPNATRAVGLANGQNPIAVVIPCHRVIGADGSLTGYGGGLDRKRWLLQHEGALRGEQRTLFA